MICYKVCVKWSSKPDIWKSCNTKICGLHYPIDKWVSAKIGGLFVFETLKAAKTFVAEYTAYNAFYIFKAECKGKIKFPTGNFYPYTLKQLKNVWTESPKKLISTLGCPSPWPPNTLTFKKVKLLKLIK